MHWSTTISTLLAAGVAGVAAQTPAGSYPITDKNLGAAYANATITPGIWIDPDYVGDQPSLYTQTALNGTFMVFMLDLNIPDSDVTTAAGSYSTLVPGLATNTTTRLHWWGGNYTVSQDGTFVNSSDALAEYTSPRPRDSTNHTYALYLFEQPAGYVADAEALSGAYYDQTSDSRFNYTLLPITEAVGGPVAATYFLSSAV